MHYCDRRLSIGNDDNNEMSSRKFIYLAIEWNSKKNPKEFWPHEKHLVKTDGSYFFQESCSIHSLWNEKENSNREEVECAHSTINDDLVWPYRYKIESVCICKKIILQHDGVLCSECFPVIFFGLCIHISFRFVSSSSSVYTFVVVMCVHSSKIHIFFLAFAYKSYHIYWMKIEKK